MKPTATPVAAKRHAQGRVRVVGGAFRGRVLAVPNVPGLRPTPDRVRETLFNWLGQRVDGWHCLDAFAGSGALGLEAASRGAARVWLVESHPAAKRLLQQAVQALPAPQAKVVVADAARVLADQAGAGWDLVLLDPPFDVAAATAQRYEQLAAGAAAEHGWIYRESPQPAQPPPGWQVWRQGRAGAVNFALWRRIIKP
jgi:16S rRNA (guanine966-N2)-methyltransferase